MKSKRFKHALMRFGGKVNRVYFEKIRFFLMRGWWPNIASPSTINEWLLVKKLGERFEKPELSGTYEAYAHVKKAYPQLDTPEVAGVIKRVEDIHQVSELSEGKYLLKGSHGSGMLLRCDIYDGLLDIEPQRIKSALTRWLNTEFWHTNGENCYRHCKPCVIIEKMLGDHGSLAVDIKVHCANGIPKVLQVIDRQSGVMVRSTWLVKNDGVLLRVNWFKNESDKIAATYQSLAEKCVEHAAILSTGFQYIRVDFLVDSEKIYFGELTYFPASNCMPLVSKAVDSEFYDHCFPDAMPSLIV